MAAVTFSLTQRCVINPILYMRANLNSDQPLSTGKKIYHFVEAEGFARINALATSVFAALDALIHLSTGCYKGVRLLLGIKSSYNKREVVRHFRRAILYSAIALTGTVTATIWPGIVKYFKPSPLQPYQKYANHPKQIPSKISLLLSQIDILMQKGSPVTKLLQNNWKTFDLTAKHWFVITCLEDNPEGSHLYSTVRKVMATTVYRHIGRTEEDVQWLNEEEMEKNFKCAHEQAFGYYYHATSEKALKSILKDRKVEVRHEKAYRGAFVSTEPELAFGKCVVVFNRTIERLSHLEHGFTLNNTTYWAGFSQDIPVNDLTVSCIAIERTSEVERNNFEVQCIQWAGRDIDVVFIDEIMSELKQIQQRHVGIPAEWPDEGEATGMNIIKAMKRALAIPVEQNEPPKRMQRPEGMPVLSRQASMDNREYQIDRRNQRYENLMLAN